MKVIEKLTTTGLEQAYSDIPEELQLFTPGCQVQPAPFISMPSLKFFFYRRYEPGEDKHSPQGTIVARGENGVKYGFDLDQVIIHPQVIKHKKTLEKMARRAEKEQAKRERKLKKGERANEKAERQKRSGGKRGRPALDPAEKARREAEKAARAQKSGGKRGRPKGSGAPKEPKAPKPAGTGKRGRPALSAEAKAAKASAKAEVRARSGGKRGRPKSKR